MRTSSPQDRINDVIARTQSWLTQAVIGLNLCLFAKAVYVKDQIHYAVSPATSAASLMQDLATEMDALMALDATIRDTTLLIAPNCFADFLDFNDFLADADARLVQNGFEGIFQIASFHPQYQFDGTTADDITNCSNRAPYPILHLLREESIDRAVAAFPNAETIYEANMETLRKLGHGGWNSMGFHVTQSEDPT